MRQVQGLTSSEANEYWGMTKKKIYILALTSVAQWLGIVLESEWSSVQFPVRAIAWAMGSVPVQGHLQGATYQCFSLTSVFLSLTFLLHSPLSKKIIK